jgi:hypothetical protein
MVEGRRGSEEEVRRISQRGKRHHFSHETSTTSQVCYSPASTVIILYERED